jgi:thioredoxin-related protein
MSTVFAKAQPVLDSAKRIAAEKHQLILLNFSGSDWCVPCIKMRKEIFENDDFKKLSDTLLVMITADFPRNKKNEPDVKTRRENEELADKYNPGGAFPYTVLLDADGKVIKAWNGLPKGDAASFSTEIKSVYNKYR